MSRSPYSYPLTRPVDGEAGGVADLQTDVMRFMAIISLCLVAIFALVQSMPMSPLAKAEAVPEQVEEPAVTVAAVKPPAQPETQPMRPAASLPVKAERTHPNEETVSLTRPKWTPKYPPKIAAETQPVTNSTMSEALEEKSIQASIETVIEAAQPAAEEAEGFTLRFESDAALTRLVASSTVGVYAMEQERARRMTVSESRISFWDASVPNSFHEMELSTVPVAVIDALSRTGINTADVSWGVTLPGKLKSQLDQLMQNYGSGSLVIAADGEIRLEET